MLTDCVEKACVIKHKEMKENIKMKYKADKNSTEKPFKNAHLSCNYDE